MDSHLFIKLTIIVAVCAVIMHEKIREFLKNKLLLDLSKGTFMKSTIGITLAMIAVVTCSSPSPNNYNKQDSELERKNRIVREAFRSAKESVESELKCPSTAKFARELDKESKYKINDDESVIIQSYIDAQNSFGAMIRTHFRCTVDKYGNVSDLTTW